MGFQMRLGSLILWFSTLLWGVTSWDQVLTVNKLRAQMYRSMLDRGCVKLLNASGAIGCELEKGSVDEAPLISFKSLPDPLLDPRVVVVSAEHLSAFLKKYQKDVDLQRQVKGVLIDSRQRPQHYSDGPTAPASDYALYAEKNYPWNPQGSSLSRAFFPFPMFLLQDDLAKDILDRAIYNHDRKYQGALYHVRMLSTMHAEGTSHDCLSQQTCQPLGGDSVWAAMPPEVPTSAPITLVLAQVDSSALIHDVISGAHSPMSGLMAMLAAAHTLQEAQQYKSYQRQVVFVALLGEPWDYMGSRRMLWEEFKKTPAMEGLDLARVDQVIEVGPVGRALAGTTSPRFFLHRQRSPDYGDPTPIISSFKEAAKSSEVPMEVLEASSGTPGIPPSSLMSFLRVKKEIQGVVVTSFDQTFDNPYYESWYDDLDNVQLKAVQSASVLLAQVIHQLASGGAGTLQVNLTETQEMVTELASCLTPKDAGTPLSCGQASKLIDVWGTNIHYVGIRQMPGSAPQSSLGKSDISRYLWNLMATLTADTTTSSGAQCGMVKNKKKREELKCGEGEVCVGYKNFTKGSMGTCLKAKARYVPSLTTKYELIKGTTEYRWTLTNESVAWEEQYNWPLDPIWTESNWPARHPSLVVYQKESRKTEVAVFVAGVLVVVFSYVITQSTRMILGKRLKQS